MRSRDEWSRRAIGCYSGRAPPTNGQTKGGVQGQEDRQRVEIRGHGFGSFLFLDLRHFLHRFYNSRLSTAAFLDSVRTVGEYMGEI